tara:strand:+ start:7600 stop:8199 length:600 start_codon:yes stop_codon:yes gene_type:complete
MKKQNLLILLFLLIPWRSGFSQSETGITGIQKGMSIWEFSGAITHNKNFIAGPSGYETIRNTIISTDFNYIRLLNNRFGVGVKGFTKIFISDGFDGIDIGTIALGPIARTYFYNKDLLGFYFDASYLIGYDMQLSDAFGSIQNGDVRFRTSLRLGSSYRVTNSLGLFIEFGPDWEGDFPRVETDAKGVELSLGFQLFKF